MGLCFSEAVAIIIKQSPVKSSAPKRITIISPTGKTNAAARRETPTLLMACDATELAAAPIAIIIPAKTALIKSFCGEDATLLSHPSMYLFTASLIVKKFSILFRTPPVFFQKRGYQI